MELKRSINYSMDRGEVERYLNNCRQNEMIIIKMRNKKYDY